MRADPLTAAIMVQPDPHGWLAPGRHAVASPVQWGEAYTMVLILDSGHDHHPPLPEKTLGIGKPEKISKP